MTAAPLRTDALWSEDRGDPWKAARSLSVATEALDPRLRSLTFVRYGGMVVCHFDRTYYVLTAPVVQRILAAP